MASNSGSSSNESPILEKANDDREGGSGVSAESVSVDNNESKISTHESDSSEYSVNKFNYFFYLIYKVKFLDVQEELEISEEEPVEILD